MLNLIVVGVIAWALLVPAPVSWGHGDPSAARAGSSCDDDGLGNHIIGYGTSSNTNANGASATIQFQNPDLCGSDTDGPSASVAWSMVAADSATYPTNNNANGWAQAGYGQFAYNGKDIATFTQWTKRCKATLSCVGSSVVTTFDVTNPSNSYTYRAYRNASTGELEMEAGPGATDASNYDPSGDWAAAWRNSYAGETLDDTSDIVGIASDRTLFDNLKRYNDNSQWVFQQSFTSINSANTRYHRSALDASEAGGFHFTLWTNPL